MQLIIWSQVTLIDNGIEKLFPYGKVLELLSKFKNICKDIQWNVNVPVRDDCKIIDDKDYLEQAISKSRILGYKNFDENGNEKFKDIKRKWAKSRKPDQKYGKAGRIEAKKTSAKKAKR